MELLQLTYFCNAAETENFSKTAKTFSVPTSNISQSIHRLETELETTLFDRTSNRVALNEQGKLFYENVKPALTMIYDAKTRLSGNAAVSGEIKILAETNRRIVTKAIEAFQDSHSGVSFFINHSSNGILDTYDLIVSDRPLEEKKFKKHLLVIDQLLLAMKNDNPLAEKSEIKIQDLEKEKFITMSNKSGLYKLTNEICGMGGFVPNIVIQSDDPYYIRKYIEMGLGISFVPSLSWRGTFSQNVECREVVSTNRYTYAYLNSQKHISKATSLFLETLLAVAGEHADAK